MRGSNHTNTYELNYSGLLIQFQQLLFICPAEELKDPWFLLQAKVKPQHSEKSNNKSHMNLIPSWMQFL